MFAVAEAILEKEHKEKEKRKEEEEEKRRKEFEEKMIKALDEQEKERKEKKLKEEQEAISYIGKFIGVPCSVGIGYVAATIFGGPVGLAVAFIGSAATSLVSDIVATRHK